jgi:hypothetical protein
MLRLAAVTVFALTALAAVAAHGEVFQHESLRVSVNASIAPHALPRQRPAPVTVRLGGRISTADGTRPPALQELSIEMNRAGLLSSRGLPTCSAPRIQQKTTEAALATCREALVGHGSFGASVDFPGAPAIPAEGKALVFNGHVGGRPGMLLHLYGSRPVRAAFVLPFAISHRSRGRFGSVLSTRIPNLASGLGYITRLQIQIGRRYSYRGGRRSFLSASCAAPAGFSGGPFELAKMTFSFDDGRQVVAPLERNCRVRRSDQ